MAMRALTVYSATTALTSATAAWTTTAMSPTRPAKAHPTFPSAFPPARRQGHHTLRIALLAPRRSALRGLDHRQRLAPRPVDLIEPSNDLLRRPIQIEDVAPYLHR